MDTVTGATLPAPSFEDLAHGPHGRNVLDLWRAEASPPGPLLLCIHGGGFRRGDKWVHAVREQTLIRQCLDAEISVAAIDYRLSGHAAYPAAMLDSARAR